MSKILVTGGAGFIGSHLCKRLLEENNEVICLDNFFTGRKENISKLLKNKNFEVIRHDVTKPILLEVDKIYNLACPASPVHYQYDPIKTIKTNMLGTMHLLEMAKQVKARFLQASTSEVYGDPHIHPQQESYWGNVNPIGIRSCYDEGKRISETLCFDYQRQEKVEVRVVRIFNTYGPQMLENDGRVVSNFVVQALQGNDLTVYGEGNQTRSFCYVDDLVDGMIKMMNQDEFSGPVNLGRPEEYTILEIAEKVLSMVETKSKIVFKPLPSDDPTKRRPNIALAKDKLNWEPTTTFDEGLSKTIEYFKSKINE